MRLKHRMAFPTPMNHPNQSVTLAENSTKPRTAGTGLMRRTILGRNVTHSQSPPAKSANNQSPLLKSSQKTKNAAPPLRGNGRRKGVHNRRPPNRYEEDFLTECNEEPTQDWQRRWNVGMILRHNARHPEDPTPLPQWITESPDNYATLKRPLPESKTERIYIYDRDYTCDPWDEPTIYDTNKLSFKIQVSNPQAQFTESTTLLSPPSPILKKTTQSSPTPVTTTPTPIDAENIICIEDKTIWTQQAKEQREAADQTVSPPTTTSELPTKDHNHADDEVTECPQQLPYDLNIIKEFIQHDKDDDYIPLMSAITLKKKKRMLFIPLDFENTRIDALVDSGAYINVISERDADKIQTEANATIIAKAPPPPFKIQYANTELEKARATYTMQFKIGDYAFEETFIIMTKTSYPIIGLAFLRKHSAILDTAQGTIDFPKIQITLALKDERQKCNPKPIIIKTEEKHTIPAQAKRIIHASITTSNDHPITGTVQPLPQFD